jgi:hypothetical protein
MGSRTAKSLGGSPVTGSPCIQASETLSTVAIAIRVRDLASGELFLFYDAGSVGNSVYGSRRQPVP